MLTIFILLICSYYVFSKHSDLYLLGQTSETIKLRFKSGTERTTLTSFPDYSFSIRSNGIDVIKYLLKLSRYDPVTDEMTSDFDFSVSKDLVFMSHNSKLSVAGIDQWKLYIHEDFQEDRAGWSEDKVGSCPGSENVFLGDFFLFRRPLQFCSSYSCKEIQRDSNT